MNQTTLKEPIDPECGNLSASLGYRIISAIHCFVQKDKQNKIRQDVVFFLENSDYTPVDFNNETLTFTIQIIEIQLKK